MHTIDILAHPSSGVITSFFAPRRVREYGTAAEGRPYPTPLENVTCRYMNQHDRDEPVRDGGEIQERAACVIECTARFLEFNKHSSQAW